MAPRHKQTGGFFGLKLNLIGNRIVISSINPPPTYPKIQVTLYSCPNGTDTSVPFVNWRNKCSHVHTYTGTTLTSYYPIPKTVVPGNVAVLKDYVVPLANSQGTAAKYIAAVNATNAAGNIIYPNYITASVNQGIYKQLEITAAPVLSISPDNKSLIVSNLIKPDGTNDAGYLMVYKNNENPNITDKYDYNIAFNYNTLNNNMFIITAPSDSTLGVIAAGTKVTVALVVGSLDGSGSDGRRATAYGASIVSNTATALEPVAAAPLTTTTGIAMMGNALAVRPLPTSAAPKASAAPAAPAAAPAAPAAVSFLTAAPPVPSGPQCSNQSVCKANGVVQGTVVKRTTPGEVPMCFYTKAQCDALNGNFAGPSGNLPAGVTGVGECLLKTGGSFTWNCRPGQGGGRMKRTRKNKKSKKQKQTRRIRKQRR
jgi:hypothetical protein